MYEQHKNMEEDKHDDVWTHSMHVMSPDSYVSQIGTSDNLTAAGHVRHVCSAMRMNPRHMMQHPSSPLHVLGIKTNENQRNTELSDRRGWDVFRDLVYLIACSLSHRAWISLMYST